MSLLNDTVPHWVNEVENSIKFVSQRVVSPDPLLCLFRSHYQIHWWFPQKPGLKVNWCSSSPGTSKVLPSVPKIRSPRPPAVYTSSQSICNPSSPYLQLISWGQGAEFCLILILSSSTVNMGHMLHICLLSAHTPSFLMKSHKFPCPFHQHVRNLNHSGYRKLVLSSLGEVGLRPALPSHLLLLWLPLEYFLATKQWCLSDWLWAHGLGCSYIS